MARIPSHYLDAVGVIENLVQVEDEEDFVATATGTLLGYQAKISPPDENDAENYYLVLVTNRHVIEGKTDIWLRFNQGTGSKAYRIGVKNEQGDELFAYSDRFDVAVTFLAGARLREEGAEFSVIPERAFLNMDGLERNGVRAGDGVFVLGFPLGIAGKQRKYAMRGMALLPALTMTSCLRRMATSSTPPSCREIAGVR